MNPAALAMARMTNGTMRPPIPIIAIGSFIGFAPSRSISDNHASFSFSLVIFGSLSSAFATTVKRARAVSTLGRAIVVRDGFVRVRVRVAVDVRAVVRAVNIARASLGDVDADSARARVDRAARAQPWLARKIHPRPFDRAPRRVSIDRPFRSSLSIVLVDRPCRSSLSIVLVEHALGLIDDSALVDIPRDVACARRRVIGAGA